jgi:hypothetical protein
MRSVIFASLAALATFSASPASAQLTTSEQETEAYSLKSCRQNMGYAEVADSDVRYLITMQCHLERLRVGHGTEADFRRVAHAIERGRVSFKQLDTSISELSELRMQLLVGRQTHTSASAWSDGLRIFAPATMNGIAPALVASLLQKPEANNEAAAVAIDD